MKTYDLIVAGGGFTGVAAAVAAAREGLHVLLIERGNCLGGAAAHNLVNPFMAYWTQKNDQRDYLSAGIFREILTLLNDAGAMTSYGTTFDEEYLKLLLNRLVLQNGVELQFNTTLIGASVVNSHMQQITVYAAGVQQNINAAYFVDATGNAELSVLGGLPTVCGREEDGLCQPMTLCFRVANVDPARFNKEARQTMQAVYTRYQNEGKIRNLRENVLCFPTCCPQIIHFNTTRVVRLNPLDPADITRAEIEAREQVFELFDLLRHEVPGFEQAYLVSTAAQIGIRESRRLVGLHTLTAEELKDCTVFPDRIAVGNYDIDIHSPTGSGTSHYYFPAGKYYTIPYRSLVPQGVDNVLVAGRCISATHEAQASIRIMPICCCLGEAAGTAIACAVQQNGCAVDAVDIPTLQQRLVKNGARIQ